MISSLSIDAYDCHLNPFHSNVNQIRNQKGQIEVAENIRNILEGSEMIAKDKKQLDNLSPEELEEFWVRIKLHG